jgi:glucoamylase
MATIRGSRRAFGAPGIEPRWTYADKDGIGTAYSAPSRIWFTLLGGIVTEVYCPTVDRAQVRDLQLLVTDGESFVHEERMHMRTTTEALAHQALGYRVVNTDPHERYSIEKTILTDPHYPSLLQRVRVRANETLREKLKVFVLCAPHLEVGGWHNNAYVMQMSGRPFLAAQKDGTWLVLDATRPFARLSCGFVGYSDGWTDLADNFKLDWEFDSAEDGNIALVGEIDDPFEEFVIALTLGNSAHNALTTLYGSLYTPFDEHEQRFIEQWTRSRHHMISLGPVSHDRGRLYASSYSLLMAHEDKAYPGAMIASMSIPWGGAKSDEDRGGYHLVWTRDLVNSVTGLLAAGNAETPRRALVYLATSQRDDGGFPQNMWINGDAYWTGIQLDEVAFPIMLARRMLAEGALRTFDPYPLVLRAAAYMIHHGPATDQERWEEASGYSPSTLANNIAGLICAACFARERGDEATASFIEDYADFLEQHLEAWTVTTQGTLVPEIPRHYIRILPVDIGNPRPEEDPNNGWLTLANVPPGRPYRFPAKEIVDAGFLELVRYGIRRPDDPIVVDSVAVVDRVLKVETPLGPCWHRYNHDGYGEQENGAPYTGYGVGRAWPLLTGERGHYELAAGRDTTLYIRTLERFAHGTGLLPEQVWDEPDLPKAKMRFGHPTGSARPLMWAHAEYVKLLRSVRDGRVFDQIPEAAARYCRGRTPRRRLEIWKPNRQVARVEPGMTLRIQAARPFLLHWTRSQWQDSDDSPAASTALNAYYVDIPVAPDARAPIVFTFFWTDSQVWEGRDYSVATGG